MAAPWVGSFLGPFDPLVSMATSVITREDGEVANSFAGVMVTVGRVLDRRTRASWRDFSKWDDTTVTLPLMSRRLQENRAWRANAKDEATPSCAVAPARQHGRGFQRRRCSLRPTGGLAAHPDA